MKGALGLQPVFHYREDRIRAHVQLCWLALQHLRLQRRQPTHQPQRQRHRLGLRRQRQRDRRGRRHHPHRRQLEQQGPAHRRHRRRRQHPVHLHRAQPERAHRPQRDHLQHQPDRAGDRDHQRRHHQLHPRPQRNPGRAAHRRRQLLLPVRRARQHRRPGQQHRQQGQQLQLRPLRPQPHQDRTDRQPLRVHRRLPRRRHRPVQARHPLLRPPPSDGSHSPTPPVKTPTTSMPITVLVPLLIRPGLLHAAIWRLSQGGARWLVSFAAWRRLRVVIAWETGSVVGVER